jgi:hypothetical protein
MGKIEGSAGRQDLTYPDSIIVQGTSLDDFHFEGENPAPHIVKMDIEGGEVLALPGMRRLLETAQPVVFLELHGPEAAQVAWDILCSTGYSVRRIAPGYPEVRSADSLDWKSYLVALPEKRAISIAQREPGVGRWVHR